MSSARLAETAVMADLLSGELRPGDRIRQDALATRLGISKIPVREALQRLEANGLLRFEMNRGAVVPTLTASDAEEHYALRRSIEPLLLERALPRLTIVDLAEAELALEGGDDPAANWQFHRALYRAGAWSRGLTICEMLHVAVAPYVLLYTRSLGGGSTSDSQHRLLLDACRAGDARAALDVLRRHLDDADTLIRDFLAA